MANRQLLPNSISPINGDVTSSVGNPDVTVTGIQGTPVLNQAPQEGQILIFDTNAPGGSAYVPGDPIVSGTDAPGTSPTKNPVQVAGIDDGNLVRELRTDTYGSIRSINVEDKLDQIIYLLRALVAATISDKAVDDSEYTADNFTDIQ